MTDKPDPIELRARWDIKPGRELDRVVAETFYPSRQISGRDGEYTWILTMNDGYAHRDNRDGVKAYVNLPHYSTNERDTAQLYKELHIAKWHVFMPNQGDISVLIGEVQYTGWMYAQSLAHAMTRAILSWNDHKD